MKRLLIYSALGRGLAFLQPQKTPILKRPHKLRVALIEPTDVVSDDDAAAKFWRPSALIADEAAPELWSEFCAATTP